SLHRWIHRAGVSAEELGSRRLSNRTQDLQQQRQQQQAEEEEERQRQRQHDKRRDSFLVKLGIGAGAMPDPGGEAAGETGEKPRLAERIRLRMRYIAKEFVVDVSQPFYYRWLAVLSVAACYNLIFIVMRSAFTQIQEEYPIWPWFLLDYAADAVYAVDASSSRACWSETYPRLRQVYMQSAGFKLDLACLFPTPMYFTSCPRSASLAPTSSIEPETRTNYPNLFRISNLILILLVVVHWNGCIYFSICLVLGLGRDSWTYPPRPDNFIALANTEPKYIYSFFWSTMILTTIGDVPRPVTDFEYAFMTVDFLVGVLIFAVVVGNVGSNDHQYECSEDRVPDADGWGRELERRVIRWFDYLWTNKQSLDEERILGTLPDKLKAEIAIHVHFDTLKRVAIFQDCEPGLLVELVLKLKLQVYSPGDYICRKGDIGKEMYIVKRGKLSVVSPDGKTVFVTLGEGSVFGEVSILNIPGNKTGNRRTANVRSDGYSDLFCLSKNDLWEALTEYPDAKVKLLEKGQQVLRKDNLIDEEALAKALQDRESTERRVERLNAELGVLQTRFARMLAEFGSTQSKLRRRLEGQETLEEFPVRSANAGTSRQTSDHLLGGHIQQIPFKRHAAQRPLQLQPGGQVARVHTNSPGLLIEEHLAKRAQPHVGQPNRIEQPTVPARELAVRSAAPEHVANPRAGTGVHGAAALPIAKRHLQILAAPGLHEVVVGAERVEGAGPDGKKTTGHHGRVERLVHGHAGRQGIPGEPQVPRETADNGKSDRFWPDAEVMKQRLQPADIHFDNDHFVQQMRRRPIENAVQCAAKGRLGLVIEADNN
uniref:Cyclic nucleotide-binding domain-containing protein n=1 Tax=Macrostomum lignano TaxID=282301 RepID=A0A1I8G420_9PLAT